MPCEFLTKVPSFRFKRLELRVELEGLRVKECENQEVKNKKRHANGKGNKIGNERLTIKQKKAKVMSQVLWKLLLGMLIKLYSFQVKEFRVITKQLGMYTRSRAPRVCLIAGAGAHAHARSTLRVRVEHARAHAHARTRGVWSTRTRARAVCAEKNARSCAHKHARAAERALAHARMCHVRGRGRGRLLAPPLSLSLSELRADTS
jgi:hypothetical protein